MRNIEGDEGLVQRRRVAMALVVVGQMLPDGAIKGGSAMALRYGRATRFTQDLDAAHSQPLASFKRHFEESLAQGWEGFTGRLVPKTAPRPSGVPSEYVMQPHDVKLSYHGKSWCTVKFELGHNEIGDAEEPEHHLAPDLSELFTTLGIKPPKQVPVMRSDHQIAQKLHAVSSPGSERARDLVDLQLLDGAEALDLNQVAATCSRLFQYRQRQTWPPTIAPGEEWESLYNEAAQHLPVRQNLDETIAWTNAFIHRITAASHES